VKNILEIFTSRARVLILRTLYFQEDPIPLRHVSEISNLPVRSVQNALNALLEEAIINRSEKDNNTLFELNKEHASYDVLEQIFILEMNARIYSEAASFCQKAKRALEFASAANTIFKRAKQKRSIK
jgi:DNA-binding transcriptional ArsR family regulator